MRETLNDYCERTGTQDLLRQWHPEKNEGVTPGDLSYGSKRRVWWRCEKGHEWQAAVYARTGSGCGCPVCAGKKVLAGVNDLASLYPQVACEWHRVKNAPLTPADVSSGSHRRVWWQCREGHEWQAQVKSRTNGCGCPVCTNREILPGKNDLATTHPDLARQWHPSKNGGLRPEAVVAGTRKKVWWQCEKGHVWQATVASRAGGGVSCPVCTGKKVIAGENDFARYFPEVAAQWHPRRNGPLRPDQLSPYSNRRVWWICALGHEWQAAVSARTMHGNGCPYCAGRKVLAGFNDLATVEPRVAAQWHPTLNGMLTPEMVTVGSHRKVWWQCPDGHVWKAVVHSRTSVRKCGCPVCAGQIRAEKRSYHSARLDEKIRAAQSCV